MFTSFHLFIFHRMCDLSLVFISFLFLLYSLFFVICRNVFKSVMSPGCLLSTQLGCGELSCLLGIASIFEYFLHPKNAMQKDKNNVNLFISGAYSSSMIQLCHKSRSTFDIKPSLNSRLSARSKRSVTEFSLAVKAKQHLLNDDDQDVFSFQEERVVPGAYVLISIDHQTGSKVYKRRSNNAKFSMNESPIVTLPSSSKSSSRQDSTPPVEASTSSFTSNTAAAAGAGVEVLVTGVSAGLPCLKQADGKFTREAFDPLNLDRLILGENMIDNLTDIQLSVIFNIPLSCSSLFLFLPSLV